MFSFITRQKGQTRQFGFTLIELLVVIAIIGLLSTISIVALNQARSKARDSRRVADMHQLINTINMYYDEYGEYPPLADVDGTGIDYGSDGNFMPNLISAGFLSSSLKDPWNTPFPFFYMYMTPAYSNFSTSWCNVSGGPQSSVCILFALENNLNLNSFAKPCSTQSADAGYRRCIPLY